MIDEEVKKALLKELEDGTKHALLCSNVAPPEGTPWESVKTNCCLCGKPLWRDARNTELMKINDMVPVCIACAIPHIDLEDVKVTAAVAGKAMTVGEALRTIVEHEGTPPEKEPDA